jgi:hypothetical protein
MNRDLENYYASRAEPVRACLQAARELIVAHDPLITEAWKYRMPFFCYRGKMFCYLWTRKDNGDPYLGVVEGQRLFHSQLVQGDRMRMKVLPLDPRQRLPEALVRSILDDAIALYTSGRVRIPAKH